MVKNYGLTELQLARALLGVPFPEDRAMPRKPDRPVPTLIEQIAMDQTERIGQLEDRCAEMGELLRRYMQWFDPIDDDREKPHHLLRLTHAALHKPI